MKPSGEITLVELHDARVSQIRFDVGRAVDIVFLSVGVHYKRDDNTSEVWTHGARLMLREVSASGLNGPIDDEGWIVDDELIVNERRADAGGWLLSGVGDLQLRLSFTNGTELSLHAGSAQLELDANPVFVEVFEQ